MTEETCAEAFTKEELEEIGRESDKMVSEIFHWLDTHPDEWNIT